MPDKNASQLKPLKKTGTIGVVSPGNWLDRASLDKSRVFLEAQGYRVVMHPQNNLRMGQLAGSDTERAQALMEMFADPAIDAIMCARGGKGAIRLLDKIDFAKIKKTPKPLTGYSDVTVLLQAIRRKCGFETFHGPMLTSFADSGDPRSARDFFDCLGQKKKNLKIAVPEVQILNAGSAEGILTGGNLMMLQSLIATPFDWTGNGAILFIEEVNEALYRIDRILNHFRLAGKFGGLRGVIVGEMVDMPDAGKPYGRSLEEILRDNLPSDIPICTHFPCGHGKYIATLPVGVRARVKIDKKSVRLSWA